MTESKTATPPDLRFSVKKPCPECPFSRKCTPGALGGSGPATYVGQAHGPFWLPCHQHTDYSDPNWKTDTSKPQCAGAAMYRNLTGADKYLTGIGLHQLSGDPGVVFSDPAELIAHHGQVHKVVAQLFLLAHPVQELVAVELDRCAKNGSTLEVSE